MLYGDFRKAVAVLAMSLLAMIPTFAQSVSTENVDVRISGDYLNVDADIVLDSLRLGSNRQVFITPVVKAPESYELSDTSLNHQQTAVNEIILPSVLVSGRNMHISFERGVLRNFPAMRNHEIWRELKRENGRPQTVAYSMRVPLEDWMRGRDTRVVFVFDSCGCGAALGRHISDEIVIFENPVNEMQSVMMLPEIEEVPIQIHEGRARVQFEVDRTELHVDPYLCRNGQRIDNRGQIQMIDDSVRYALTDPNVEISAIEICGYASPESPYLHNEELANGRSKALAEYLADRYHLPKGSVTYSSVPENWGEFRELVVASDELTDGQRMLLLELIDAPAESPEDYDAKEKTLKTDPRYSSLYRSKILPEWFPKLRATTFAIHTRLKDLSDEQLKEVIKETPEKMSLNQMYRVARLYPEDSDEFNEVMLTALRYYPRDQIAITNAATAAVIRGEYDRARRLLSRAENTPAVYNLLGIIATAEERYDEAERYFEKASGDANAERNLELLK